MAKPSWNLESSHVAAASLRRIRKLKSKEARERDKETIRRLEGEVAWMRSEVAQWWTWYQQRWMWQEKEEVEEEGYLEVGRALSALAFAKNEEHRLVGGASPRSEGILPRVGTRQAAEGAACIRTIGIDYSRWDRLVCSSEEEPDEQSGDEHRDEEDEETGVTEEDEESEHMEDAGYYEDSLDKDDAEKDRDEDTCLGDVGSDSAVSNDRGRNKQIIIGHIKKSTKILNGLCKAF